MLQMQAFRTFPSYSVEVTVTLLLMLAATRNAAFPCQVCMFHSSLDIQDLIASLFTVNTGGDYSLGS